MASLAHPSVDGRASARPPLGRLAALLAGPLAIAVASGIYLAVMIGDMSTVPGMMTMMMAPQMLAPLPLFGLFLMWAVMMAAMMLPTALPMILAYTRMLGVNRRAGWVPVFLFSGGYVLAWAGFSLAAAALQAALTHFALLSPMMMKVVAGPMAGGILIIAGLYQLTPLKQSCLRQCRSPISFLMTRWREGNWGALAMGWSHGLFCVGCCWALMGLLFVAGVMNPVWIIAITAYVLVEKIIPGGRRLSQLCGIGMTGLGLYWMLA